MSEQVRPTRTAAFEARLRKRYAAEKRFKALGFLSVMFSIIVLAILIASMSMTGFGGFQRVEMAVPVNFSEAGMTVDVRALEQRNPQSVLENAGLPMVIQMAAEKTLGAEGAAMLAQSAWNEAADQIIENPSLLAGETTFWLPVRKEMATAFRGDGKVDLQPLAQRLQKAGLLERRLDLGFLTRADATDSQMVGIWGALKGSILTMLVTLALAFPIGVLAALYLEEYAPKNRWTDLIEVSINNLAAVPSIIFGLLGLAVFLAIFPNYRSAPLIGGMTLALMTMPVIVISGRNAIKAVPPSIRDGALAIGASPVQVVFHHVLPLAMPGILTGTIIGMARALGETAPLLMIGMRAFVASPPDGFTSPATVLPVQIFLWSDEIDRGFVERTSAAIIVLLLFLLVMNGLAIYLRNRFERKW
jgi:phosphate transport system permease protein